jgi:nucleoside-diphosphate-sugar epimerase
MNIVVTGISGLIGRKLTAIFVGAGHDIAGIDRRDGHDLSIMGDWHQSFTGATAVVHLAASAHPASSLEDIQRNNFIATSNVVQACIIHRVPRLVFASSTHVALGRYGYPGGKDEPENFYGLSKLFGEHLVRLYAETNNQSAASVRIGWVPTAEQLQQQPEPWIRSIQVSDEALTAAFLAATLDPFSGYRLIECVGPLR